MQSPRDGGQCSTQGELRCGTKAGAVLPTEPHSRVSSDLLLPSITRVYYKNTQGPTKPCQSLSRHKGTVSPPSERADATVAAFHRRLKKEDSALQ